MRAVFRRDAVGIDLGSATAATATAAAIVIPFSKGRYGACYKDEHVVFVPQMARIDVLCIDDIYRKMILFHDKTYPARRDRAAIGIPEGDTCRSDLDRVGMTAAGIKGAIPGRSVDGLAGFEQVVDGDIGSVAAGVELAAS